MALTLKQSHLEAYIKDPVLAAWAIFGAELDVFQRVRLRYMWWVPDVIDDSGVSTGKTEILWIWAQLRAILLPQPIGYPDRVIGIYYPTLESAKSNFMPKYQKYIETSPVFRNELRPMHGGKLGYQSLDGAIQWVFRNGSIIQCPAANYSNDSKNQASKRFSDVGVDEAKEADAASQGLDDQILSRVTAPGWNSGNPVWANHTVLMGHAEDPDTHPFYKRRIKPFRALIRDGSQNHAIITSCYRDWTPPFQKKYRPDGKIRTARISMPKARFRQQWEGVWEHGSEDWYESADLRRATTRRAPVLVKRANQATISALGWDTAPGATRKADLNGGVIAAADPLPWDTRENHGVFRVLGKAYRIYFPWAVQTRGRSAGELSGIIHRADQRFGLRRVVFDPGGGGAWVQKELWKKEQFFDGRLQNVTGLCTPESAFIYPEARPLLTPFSRGSAELSPVWGEDRFRNSDEGIIEAIHRVAQAMFSAGAIWWPASLEERSPAEQGGMDAEQRMALITLTEALSQFLTIKVVIGPDGAPRVTKRGFLMFRAEGKRKKDLAYAALYALAGLLSVLMDPDFNADEEDDAESGLCVASG